MFFSDCEEMIAHKRAILAVLGKLRVPNNTLDLYGD
jgi:hypothetical protein